VLRARAGESEEEETKTFARMSFDMDDSMVMFQLDAAPPPVTSALRSAEEVEEHLRRYGSVEIAPYLGFVKERRISGAAYGLLERSHLEQWLGGGALLWGPIAELLSFKQSEHSGKTVTIPKKTLIEACLALLNDPAMRDTFLSAVSGKEHETAQLRRIVRARVEAQSGGMVQLRIKNPTAGVRRIVQFLEKKKSGNGYVIKVKYNNQLAEEWIKRSAVPKSIMGELESFEKLWDATMAEAVHEQPGRSADPDHTLHGVTLGDEAGHTAGQGTGVVVHSREMDTIHRQHEESVLAGLPPPPGVMDPDLGKGQKGLHGTDSVSPAGMDYWSPLEELQTPERSSGAHDGPGPPPSNPTLPARMDVACESPPSSHGHDDGDPTRKRRRQASKEAEETVAKRKRTTGPA